MPQQKVPEPAAELSRLANRFRALLDRTGRRRVRGQQRADLDRAQGAAVHIHGDRRAVLLQHLDLFAIPDFKALEHERRLEPGAIQL